jgi:hypothetical protein
MASEQCEKNVCIILPLIFLRNYITKKYDFNNYTTNNNNTMSGPITDATQDGKMPAASGVAQSTDLNALYERMQVEGMRQMENIMTQMKVQMDIVEKTTEKIDRKIDDIKE